MMPDTMGINQCRSAMQSDSPKQHPFLFRTYVETQLVAVSILRPDVAAAASRRAWQSQLSADALTLLDAVVRDPAGAWLCPTTLAESEKQFQLIDAALDLPLDAIRFHSIGSLLELARGPLHASSAQCEAAP